MYFVLLSISLRTTTQEESGAFVILLGWESNVFCKKVSAECLLSIFSPVLHARPSKPTSPGERGLASRWAVKTAEVAEVVEAAEAHHHLRAKALDLTSGGVLATHTHTHNNNNNKTSLVLELGYAYGVWCGKMSATVSTEVLGTKAVPVERRAPESESLSVDLAASKDADPFRAELLGDCWRILAEIATRGKARSPLTPPPSLTLSFTPPVSVSTRPSLLY